MWALECRFPQQTIEKTGSATDYRSAKINFRSMRLTFFLKLTSLVSNKALNHKRLVVLLQQNCSSKSSWIWEGAPQCYIALGLGCAWVGIWPELIKRQRLEKEKKLICDKFALGLKVQFGVSWVRSLLHVSVMKYCKAHFPAQVSQGNRLQKPLCELREK